MREVIEDIASIIDALHEENERLLVAIDGRCAAGKTTLARRLQERYECNVIHLDHFFLRDEQRTPERLATPGGNVDYERFLSEVLVPLRETGRCVYRPFDCGNRKLTEPVRISEHAVTIIEGSYSCHPALWDYYDVHMFLTVDSKEQMRRILGREGAQKAEMFRTRWIPLEERYFSTFCIEERCEYRYEMDGREF